MRAVPSRCRCRWTFKGFADFIKQDYEQLLKEAARVAGSSPKNQVVPRRDRPGGADGIKARSRIPPISRRPYCPSWSTPIALEMGAAAGALRKRTSARSLRLARGPADGGGKADHGLQLLREWPDQLDAAHAGYARGDHHDHVGLAAGHDLDVSSAAIGRSLGFI